MHVLPKSVKLDKAASKEKDHILAHPWIADWKNGKAVVATNGRILALIPIASWNDKPDENGQLPLDVLEAARKSGSPWIHLGKTEIQLGDTGAKFPRDSELTFPKFEQVIPKGRVKFVCTLNVELLWNLAQALGVKAVRMEYYGNNQWLVYPIHYRSYEFNQEPPAEGSFGCFMGIDNPANS
jgi:hypothetical protein